MIFSCTIIWWKESISHIWGLRLYTVIFSDNFTIQRLKTVQCLRKYPCIYCILYPVESTRRTDTSLLWQIGRIMEYCHAPSPRLVLISMIRRWAMPPLATMSYIAITYVGLVWMLETTYTNAKWSVWHASSPLTAQNSVRGPWDRLVNISVITDQLPTNIYQKHAAMPIIPYFEMNAKQVHIIVCLHTSEPILEIHGNICSYYLQP